MFLSTDFAIDQTMPYQENTDCGVFMMAALEYLSRNAAIDFSSNPVHVNRFRIQITTQIFLHNVRHFRPLNWMEQLPGDSSVAVELRETHLKVF